MLISVNLARASGHRKTSPSPPRRLWLSDEEGATTLARFVPAREKRLAVVYRHYRHPERTAVGRRLAFWAAGRRMQLFWGWHPGLAPPPGAAAIHLPHWVKPPSWRGRRTVCVAVHNRRELRAAIAHRAQLALISPAFAVNKSAKPLGRYGISRLAKRLTAAGLATYALGGITAKTARRLAGLPLNGFAAHRLYAAEPTESSKRAHRERD